MVERERLYVEILFERERLYVEILFERERLYAATGFWMKSRAPVDEVNNELKPGPVINKNSPDLSVECTR